MFSEVLAPVFTCLVRHGYMPPVYRAAVILPIPKGGNTDLSQSSSYRCIALASCFSKLLEYCILENFGSSLLSSHLQFVFKPGLCTTMCTGVLKAVISCYLAGGSCMAAFQGFWHCWPHSAFREVYWERTCLFVLFDFAHMVSDTTFEGELEWCSIWCISCFARSPTGDRV